MDPLQIMKDYWPRVAEVHYKDAPTHLRGTKSWRCPSRARNRAAITGSANLGGPDSGGVDFPAIQKFLIAAELSGLR